MNTAQKEKQLQRHQWLATGLFLIMAVGFIITTLYQNNNSASWLGYLKAFTEAAMVGALADWFAVTALFHHPFGIKIPHTNLIENSKEKIGDNLGLFVVDNFLSPKNIRPYIQNLEISPWLSQWLSSPYNRQKAIDETSKIFLDIVHTLDDSSVEKFLESKAEEILEKLPLNQILAQGLHYFVQQNEHQQAISYLSSQIQLYIHNHQELIREKVSGNSYSFVPKFIDEKIADKITSGLMDFFSEVKNETNHPLRKEITLQLLQWAEEMKNDTWKQKIRTVQFKFLQSEKLTHYVQNIWQSIKNSIVKELNTDDSLLKKYVDENLLQFADQLKNDKALQEKTNGMVRSIAYRYILRNSKKMGNLISDTVGNWKGKELSQKLELEVGKDLQFIRINGTLVGGLVGLIIYAISEWLSSAM
ncbi:MAG: DUF445 domain-containing protein [Bacteroidetes bacterium]|nr:DUF445 domain-containing protein [Bacteroidota bacterium]